MKYSYRCGRERQKNHNREQKYKVQSVEKARSNERKSGWKKSRIKYSIGKYRAICGSSRYEKHRIERSTTDTKCESRRSPILTPMMRSLKY